MKQIEFSKEIPELKTPLNFKKIIFKSVNIISGDIEKFELILSFVNNLGCDETIPFLPKIKNNKPINGVIDLMENNNKIEFKTNTEISIKSTYNNNDDFNFIFNIELIK